jgi:outer membrane protein TolC
MTKGNYLPSVSLTYSTEWAKTNLTDEFENNGTVSLVASIPIFPIYDNYLEVQKSQIDQKKIDLNKKQLDENIKSMINSTVYSLVLGARQFYSAGLAENLALETYSNVQERAESGISTEDELNNARLNLLRAKYNSTNAYYSILRAKSELLKIIGSDNENDIINLF